MTTAINVATTSERELSIDDLDAVSGGSGTAPTPTPKIYEAACKGTHLPEVSL